MRRRVANLTILPVVLLVGTAVRMLVFHLWEQRVTLDATVAADGASSGGFAKNVSSSIGNSASIPLPTSSLRSLQTPTGKTAGESSSALKDNLPSPTAPSKEQVGIIGTGDKKAEEDAAPDASALTSTAEDEEDDDPKRLFCPECIFNFFQQECTTCQDRANYFVTRYKHTEQSAVEAVLKAEPVNCRRGTGGIVPPMPPINAPYFAERAATLREEATFLRRQLDEEGKRYDELKLPSRQHHEERARGEGGTGKSGNFVETEPATGADGGAGGDGGAASSFPYPVHFYTYATYSEGYNNTSRRILGQASRTGFFRSGTALRPDDLPPDFSKQCQPILSMKRGGGYWLWRYPSLELAIDNVPLGHYVLFLDAGCAFRKGTRQTFIRALDALERSSSSPSDERKEITRFWGAKATYMVKVFTTPRVLAAFHLISPISEQSNSSTVQREFMSLSNITAGGLIGGGLFLFRNGPQIREFLAFVYDALGRDPYVITDRYNCEAKRLMGDYVKENRHDMSLSDVASKVLDSHNDILMAPSLFDIARLREPTIEEVEKLEEEERKDPREW